MRALAQSSIGLLALMIASAASAVTMDWTPIGNGGNACDPQSDGCYGSVGYAYSIGTYEVTNAQYTEFLNAKGSFDALGLYDAGMGLSGFNGGIIRSGSYGSYSYSTIAGRENWPVNFVTFSDALRFANWMNNGQGNADTESGSYTLQGGDITTVTRNPSATIALPSENEWYKSAYYDTSSTSYFDYPAASNAPTSCAAPTGAANRANCNDAVNFPSGSLTPVGSYAGSASPYGTFDQGGNVAEWNDTIIGLNFRGIRGGDFRLLPSDLAASSRFSAGPSGVFGAEYDGFRLVMIPEPSTGLLVIAGLLGLAGSRRARE